MRGRRAKVNAKTILTIVRESDLPDYEDDSATAALDSAKDDVDPITGVQKIKTGVEEQEEKVSYVTCLAFSLVPIR